MILVLATQNQDKAKEIAAILEGEIDITLKTLADFPELTLPPETGTSYRDNAIEKALFVAMETGHVALGDDSGLEVEALQGAPGLYSARFAGEHVSYQENRDKLIGLLKGLPAQKRGARFISTLAIVTPKGQVDVVTGTCEGQIPEVESGGTGFGYDPVFYYPPLNCTFSDLSNEEKNQHSQRGRAVHAAIPILRGLILQNV
ncbi:Nucleoside 5-triphosphatase RdgB (dHAPTP, dITP, XTP-specific) [hydrothermal vent metagenome]|uniref:dITP/XTP pyrophosphatase n=1 Tax=hydrothermal vent metagenome TaxID=652676 RepID=A0A3B1CYB5_9ZZZZ